MKKILILEDEPIVAMDLQYACEDAGARVRVASCCADANGLLDDEAADGAILDVNLGGGETCAVIARRLATCGIPFLLHTGDLDRSGEFLREFNAPVIPKPTLASDVADAVLKMVESPPVPNAVS